MTRLANTENANSKGVREGLRPARRLQPENPTGR